ncbi:MAG: LytS/YhcK type 5TM receptor domain-containing protein, partial [Leptolinea sp.]
MNNSFLELIQNAALLLALIVMFDLISQNWSIHTRVQNLLLGVVLGGLGITIMLTPWVLMPGVAFDTRSILLGISGLFFGTLPTVIAMLMTAALRLNQGGTGVVMGVSVIIASGSIGILWRKFLKNPIINLSALELYLFGLVIHIVMLLLTLTLPTMQTTLTVLSNIG